MEDGKHSLITEFGILLIIKGHKMKSKLLVLCGFIWAIPAIILVLNTCTYALMGSGFLIAGDENINGARFFIGWLSATLAVCFFGAACT
jgi:hypothetical protein